MDKNPRTGERIGTCPNCLRKWQVWDLIGHEVHKWRTRSK